MGTSWPLAAPRAYAASPSPEAPSARRITLADLPPALRETLSREGRGGTGTFDAYVRAIEARSAQRTFSGELEHLIYFVLQSARFTLEAPIEPARSATEYVRRLTEEERQGLAQDEVFRPPLSRLPEGVERRFRAFLTALARPPADERFAHFAALVPEGAGLPFLNDLYVPAMRFLYLKEGSPHPSRDVAGLYQERAYSTDTGFEANFPVYEALSVLKRLAPGERLSRVLIVGPGLDLAPRTDLIEAYPPQSYQPLAVADAVLGLALAEPGTLQVHSVDVSEAVVRYLRRLQAGKVTTLSVLSGLVDTPARPLAEDYRRYFREFGSHAGRISARGTAPPPYGDRLHTEVAISSAVASRLTAGLLNVITSRYDPSPGYDLVVATNVFPYFSDTELELALANLSSMLRPGGYLVHNDNRPALAALAAAQGLPGIHMRTVVLSPRKAGALYDTAWIHQAREGTSIHASRSADRLVP